MPASARALGGFPRGAEDYTGDTVLHVPSAHRGVQEPVLLKDARQGDRRDEGDEDALKLVLQDLVAEPVTLIGLNPHYGKKQAEDRFGRLRSEAQCTTRWDDCIAYKTSLPIQLHIGNHSLQDL